MSAKDREVAKSIFDKRKRREAEITGALQQEHAKHEAAMKNMQRLRSLRLQRDAEPKRAAIKRVSNKTTEPRQTSPRQKGRD